MLPAGETIHFFKDVVRDSIRVEFVFLEDDFGHALVAEKFARGVLRVADAVGVKHHDVAGIQNETPLVVGCLLKNPERKSFNPDFLAAAVVIQERLLLAGVGDAYPMAAAMPRGEAKS